MAIEEKLNKKLVQIVLGMDWNRKLEFRPKLFNSHQRTKMKNSNHFNRNKMELIIMVVGVNFNQVLFIWS